MTNCLIDGCTSSFSFFPVGQARLEQVDELTNHRVQVHGQTLTPRREEEIQQISAASQNSRCLHLHVLPRYLPVVQSIRRCPATVSSVGDVVGGGEVALAMLNKNKKLRFLSVL